MAMMAITREQAKIEASILIEGTLRSFVARTPRVEKPPRYAWSLEFPPHFIIPDLIVLPEHIIVAGWMVDKEKTKRALRYSLAHEFAHYSMYVVLAKNPWRIMPRLKLYSQATADAHAFRLTGITPKENRRLWGELIDEILSAGLTAKIKILREE